MIVSHQHRYVFVNVPKNAGTTVATHLAQHLGPRDLMLGSWKEALANGAKLNRRMTRIIVRNRSLTSVLRNAWRGRSMIELLDPATDRCFSGQLWDHSSLVDIEKHETFDNASYYKFCVVRNPFERIVSLYNWRYKKKSVAHPSPPCFVLSKTDVRMSTDFTGRPGTSTRATTRLRSIS